MHRGSIPEFLRQPQTATSRGCFPASRLRNVTAYYRATNSLAKFHPFPHEVEITRDSKNSFRPNLRTQIQIRNTLPYDARGTDLICTGNKLEVRSPLLFVWIFYRIELGAFMDQTNGPDNRTLKLKGTLKPPTCGLIWWRRRGNSVPQIYIRLPAQFGCNVDSRDRSRFSRAGGEHIHPRNAGLRMKYPAKLYPAIRLE